MPYEKASELPPRVKNNLRPHQQAIYMRVFNSMFKQGYSEAECSKAAWSKAQEARVKA